MSSDRLFDDDVDPPRPAPAVSLPGGAPRLLTANRAQVRMEAMDLESLLPPEHEARALWAIVETLDLCSRAPALIILAV